MLGVEDVDDAKMKLQVEMTPECSRAAAAAAHGVHGCCSMPHFQIFKFFLFLFLTVPACLNAASLYVIVKK